MALAALLIALLAAAAGPLAAPQTLEEQVRAVASQLRCPVCQNESVADSPSELAGQMREEIRRRLHQGEPPKMIIAYFVSRYGEWILLDPPRRGLGWALWLAPVALFAIGVLTAARFVRRKVGPAS